MTFFLTTVFMFMVFWRPQEWLFPWLFGLPVLDVVVCLAIITTFMEVEQGKLRIPKEKPQVYLLVGLWLATLMSHVANTYFEGVLQTLPVVFKICFFTGLLFCVLDRPSRLRKVAILFVAVSCIMSVHALMQEHTGRGFAGLAPMYIKSIMGNPPYTRSFFFGIFGDPNDMAQMLATSIPLAFAIPRRRSCVTRLLCWSAVALMYAALLTTHSRGGMLAFITVMVVMFALALPVKTLPVTIVMGLIVALALCPLGAAFLDESAHNRIMFWGNANQIFKENPVFGIGYGMFWMVGTKSAAHNAFVSCYTTIGLFGYWFWFLLIYLGIVGTWRSRVALMRPMTDEEAWLKRFAGLLIAAMAGFCSSSYFLSRTFLYPFFFLFAIMGALPVVVEKILPANHPPLLKPRMDVFVVGSAAVLASIAYIYFSIILLNKAVYG
ncbi:MAG: hypothetical protein DRP42_05945 [Tenericutes bacterium]|nr:MAG: hypothetical protein DRP42_05945 [Mycoplasmatota bacterium]